jgi:GTP cyclohydrolase I
MQSNIPDIQKDKPRYKIPLERVGITGFKLPIILKDKVNKIQNTIATIDCFVDLDESAKGINMSRLPIAIQEYSEKEFNMSLLYEIAEHIKSKSEAERCQLVYRFPYFVKKYAPQSNNCGVVYYNVALATIVNGDKTRAFMSVEITGTSNCPCSKEISKDEYGNGHGAHGQRSNVKIIIELNDPSQFIWIEELIKISEDSTSCDIYSVLKRVDEKEVTIKAYNNPKFVEDIVRECYYNVINTLDVKHATVEVSNEESIHLHNAVAYKSSDSFYDIKL